MNYNVIAFPKTYTPPPSRNLEFPEPPDQVGTIQTTLIDKNRHPFMWERPIRLLISVLPDTDQQTQVTTRPDRLACHEALGTLAVDFARVCFGPTADLLPMIAALEESNGGLFYTILLDVPYHASLLELERLTYEAFDGLLDDPANDEGIPGVVISRVAGPGELLHFMGRVIPTTTESNIN